MVQTHWLSSAATHCGAVRSMNEDAFLNRNNEGLWAVADGMGGHEAGEVASAMIVNSMTPLDLKPPLVDIVDSLEDALLEVHHNIRTYSRTHCEGRTMGSTVVSLFIRQQVGVCLWVGDSRLYRLRKQQLVQISEDHSQVNEMLSRGMISEQEAVNHPASNVITRAVGANETLYVDATVVELQKDDIYLLCSDGLYGALSEAEISLLLQTGDVEKATQSLIDQALQAGARDNVTVVAVKIQ
ncbi:serine/threonine-protein phosphatase [Ketobacter sp. MCCC 1A13808]|nr:serine/threonine-protein phosphatase [Ketobacter sp. MCCC 1A13808]RLP54275.1 MAG: serine/threonine-protein phosphatase [Ketobacter sp.]